MKYLFILLITFSSCLFLSCENTDIEPDVALRGEWAYVGDFSHRADQVCQGCLTFKYDSALYKLQFNSDRSITGRVNLLIMDGFYVTSDTEKQGNFSEGTIRISKFNPQNKPLETPADTEFQEKFRSATSYHVAIQTAGSFDYLTIQYADNKYLYFARKK